MLRDPLCRPSDVRAASPSFPEILAPELNPENQPRGAGASHRSRVFFCADKRRDSEVEPRELDMSFQFRVLRSNLTDSGRASLAGLPCPTHRLWPREPEPGPRSWSAQGLTVHLHPDLGGRPKFQT